MPDYLKTAAALRRKAADPVVPQPEREALLAKAAKLEAKYGKPNSQPADDTTVTSRSGQTFDTGSGRWMPSEEFFRMFYDQTIFTWTYQSPQTEELNRQRYEEAVRQANRLREQQWQWNPPPEDEDVEHDHWEEEDDEDAGYDIY